MTFLLSWTLVKIECTLQVLLNIDPKLRVNPDIKIQALAVQMYGNASILVKWESKPSKMTEMYVKIHPIIIRLFMFGDDILICLTNVSIIYRNTKPKCVNYPPFMSEFDIYSQKRQS